MILSWLVKQCIITSRLNTIKWLKQRRTCHTLTLQDKSIEVTPPLSNIVLPPLLDQ